MTDRDLPYEYGGPRPRRPRPAPALAGVRPGAVFLLLALAAGLGAFGVWAGGRFLPLRTADAPLTNPDAQPRAAVANGPLDGEEVGANALYQGLRPSVVNVDTVIQTRDRYDDRLLEQQAGTGSGFFWDADGRIVTNFHVVQEALRRPNVMGIRVVLADRSTHPARVVGAAPNFDLAVIQIDPPADARPVPVATSADLKVGQKVFAIGNPFGLSLTLTAGIISNLDRAIESPTGSPIPGAVQHTAQINPGNSGGPLLNKQGQLVGVNTSISTPNGGNVGIGFAIPSDTVNRVVTEVIRTGRVQRPDLGVRLYDHERLRRAGYEQGVMVADVVRGGPAAKAGLRGVRRDPETGRGQPGDLILAVGGEEVNSPEEFQRVVSKLKPGQGVVVRYVRDEDEREVKMTVQGV